MSYEIIESLDNFDMKGYTNCVSMLGVIGFDLYNTAKLDRTRRYLDW